MTTETSLRKALVDGTMISFKGAPFFFMYKEGEVVLLKSVDSQDQYTVTVSELLSEPSVKVMALSCIWSATN